MEKAAAHVPKYDVTLFISMIYVFDLKVLDAKVQTKRIQTMKSTIHKIQDNLLYKCQVVYFQRVS